MKVDGRPEVLDVREAAGHVLNFQSLGSLWAYHFFLPAVPSSLPFEKRNGEWVHKLDETTDEMIG